MLMKALSLRKFSRDKKHSHSIPIIFQCLLKFWHIWLAASEKLYLIQPIMNGQNLYWNSKANFHQDLQNFSEVKGVALIRELTSSSSPYNPIPTQILR